MAINSGPYDTERSRISAIWNANTKKMGENAVASYSQQLTRKTIKDTQLDKLILTTAKHIEETNPCPEGLDQTDLEGKGIR